ncbi:MAG: hypothetical protein IKR09_07440 [Alphaproteobacteria bacterium]|nr:hypothetical protein [Alphaproteobacteria bacterium]
MLYWDLIEEFLPDFEERKDVEFSTALFCFIHGGEVAEKYRETMQELARNEQLAEFFYSMEKHFLNQAFDAYFQKEILPKISDIEKEYGSE